MKYTTFAYWIQARRRKQNPSTPFGENQFLMVAVDAASRADGFTVEISHGVTLKITTLEEARLAAELIKSLRPTR